MNKEWETVQIGTRLYAFAGMPGEKQFLTSLKVTEAFGGICMSVIPLLGLETGKKLGKVGIKELASTIDLSQLGDTLATAMTRISPLKIKDVADDLMPHWLVTEDGAQSGHRCSYDDFTAAKAPELLKVLGYALRYYFSDFFLGLISNGGTTDPAQAVQGNA